MTCCCGRRSAAPERDALVFPDQRVSYAELAGRARRVARGLIGAGRAARREGRLLMANSVETVATFYGIALAGGVIVPINTRYRARELPFVISQRRAGDDRDQRPDRRLRRPAGAAGGGAAARGVSARSSSSATREAPGTISQAAFDAFADDGHRRRRSTHRRLRVKVGGLAVLLFTSGTTSQPRACVHLARGAGAELDDVRPRLPDAAGREVLGARADVPPRRDRPDRDELRDGRGDADRRLVRPDARARAARARAAGDPLPRLPADHDGRARAPALRGDRPRAPRARSSTSARPTCCARSRPRCRTRRW